MWSPPISLSYDFCSSLYGGLVAKSCPTLVTHGLEPARLLCPRDSHLYRQVVSALGTGGFGEKEAGETSRENYLFYGLLLHCQDHTLTVCCFECWIPCFTLSQTAESNEASCSVMLWLQKCFRYVFSTRTWFGSSSCQMLLLFKCHLPDTDSRISLEEKQN